MPANDNATPARPAYVPVRVRISAPFLAPLCECGYAKVSRCHGAVCVNPLPLPAVRS